jgi:hypothetical protein
MLDESAEKFQGARGARLGVKMFFNNVGRRNTHVREGSVTILWLLKVSLLCLLVVGSKLVLLIDGGGTICENACNTHYIRNLRSKVVFF